jgi:RHS repeat-associated protein
MSTFAYDALGRRVAITDGATATRYRWCGERICAARTPAGAISARYFSQGEMNGTTSRYYATDHLGSVRSLMDNTGSAKGTAIYHAYGKPTLTGEIPTFAYAGMFYHQASGLYLTQYRAYDSSVGRWISRDPVGEPGGTNLYAYVGNNPLQYVDLFGLDEIGGHPVLGYGHEFILLNNGGTISFEPADRQGNVDSNYVSILSGLDKLNYFYNADWEHVSKDCHHAKWGRRFSPPPPYTAQGFDEALRSYANSYPQNKYTYDASTNLGGYNSNSAIKTVMQHFGLSGKPNSTTTFQGVDKPVPEW